jgi:hypothetical protein
MGSEHNKQSGECAELRVAAKISELGGTVSFPHGDSAGYDLIAEFESKVSRLQVKSTRVMEGLCYRVYCRRSKYTAAPYSAFDCDLIVCDVPFAFYVIPVDKIGDAKSLRMWEPGTNRFYKKHPHCLWEEYREAWYLLKP